ncbi:MAG: prenyltransferase [Nocardioides sp.]
MPIPYVDGVLSAAQVRATGASIASMQQPSGAIPWTIGEHTDIWNHVEAAMALLVAGERDAAERALMWVPTMQRPDGSWPMKIVHGPQGPEVEDDRGETNMSAYLAVGVWHHWLVTGDRGLVDTLWPVVKAGLDWVITLQAEWGAIAWTPVDEEFLLTGNSSIYQSLLAGVALAGVVGESVPRWADAAALVQHGICRHRDDFANKSTFAMDWYYPVLGGAVRDHGAWAGLQTRWDDFVMPGLGVRCVDTNPWMTGAETCELVMALDALAQPDLARTLLADMQVLRHESGGYWTGLVLDPEKSGPRPGQVFWPVEHTTYTAAAVILATDALGARFGAGSPGSGIMRGAGLGAGVADVMPACARCG